MGGAKFIPGFGPTALIVIPTGSCGLIVTTPKMNRRTCTYRFIHWG